MSFTYSLDWQPRGMPGADSQPCGPASPCPLPRQRGCHSPTLRESFTSSFSHSQSISDMTATGARPSLAPGTASRYHGNGARTHAQRRGAAPRLNSEGARPCGWAAHAPQVGRGRGCGRGGETRRKVSAPRGGALARFRCRCPGGERRVVIRPDPLWGAVVRR